MHLFDDPMYVALPVGHRFAEQPKLDLSAFATEPWMLATTATCPDSRLFLRACHAAGFEPQVAIQNDDYPAIIGFVAAGVGVALIPDMVSRNIRDDVVVRVQIRRPLRARSSRRCRPTTARLRRARCSTSCVRCATHGWAIASRWRPLSPVAADWAG